MRSSQLGLLLSRRRRRIIQRQNGLDARLGRTVGGLGLGLVFLAGAGVLLLVLAYASLTSDLPALENLPALMHPNTGLLLHPTQLYDRLGTTLLLSLEPVDAPRRYLPLDSTTPDRLSPDLARVAVAVLQTDYWESPGFSLAGLTSPQPVTLAEQLVDGLLLADEPPSLRRTLRMHLLAAQTISEFGHGRVLEWVLNFSSFGHLAYGAESAARLYLDKSSSQLNIAESALLVAVLQAPALNPLDAPAAALERQRAVLEQLVTGGKITPDEYRQAAAAALTFRPAAPALDQPAPAYTAAVVDELARRFGRTRLERGGLRVITSLDLALQHQLDCTLQVQLARLEGKTTAQPEDSSGQSAAGCPAASLLPSLPASLKTYPPGLRGSILVYEPDSGQILAWVGDATTGGELPQAEAHQPGTALSPFLAMAAFSRGFSPASLTWDIPGRLPENYEALAAVEGKYSGPLRFRTALANNRLVPLQQTLLQIGAGNVWRLTEPLGLTHLNQEKDPAGLLFGGGDTSLASLAQAYGTFARMGTLVGQRLEPGAPIQPVSVLSVVDLQGRILFEQKQPDQQSVLTPALAYLVHNVLSDEPARWPSLGYPNSLEIGRPAGAGIGLVADPAQQNQVWAYGYTRQLLTIAWLSLPPEISSTQSLDWRAAAGLWHAVMQYTHRDLPALGWEQPPGISTLEVCDPSGYLPTTSCPGRATEIFLNGNEPTGPDPLYQVFQVNRETGLLATVFTPPELVEDRTYLVLPAEAQAWGVQAGLPVPPGRYDRIQPPAPLANVQIAEPALLAVVRGKVTLRGSAGGAGFGSYRLQVGAGLNPTAWLNVGQGDSPVKDGLLATWDTQGLEGLYALRLQVVRSDNQVETAMSQVTVDNTPPVVRLVSPLAGLLAVPAGGNLSLQAEATDNGQVARVEFWIDERLVGTVTSAPYVLAWPVPPGEHTLFAAAYDEPATAARAVRS